MATFGFGPCEAMHTFNLPCKNPSDYFKRWRPSDLGPARRCTRSWWPAFNVSPHAVESSEQKFHPISKQNNLGINYRLSLECERLSEIMNKTSLIPKMSISYPQCSVIDMTQDGTRQNIPPPSLHRRPADLVRKVFGHLHLQVIVQSLKCFQGESSRSSSCLRVIEGKDAQDLCQECKVSQSCFILEIFLS